MEAAPRPRLIAPPTVIGRQRNRPADHRHIPLILDRITGISADQGRSAQIIPAANRLTICRRDGYPPSMMRRSPGPPQLPPSGQEVRFSEAQQEALAEALFRAEVALLALSLNVQTGANEASFAASQAAAANSLVILRSSAS